MNRTRKNKASCPDASEVVRRSHSEILIDGYNLMHVTRFKPRNQQQGELQRCREGLLSLLAEHLPPSPHRNITVVFDSDRKGLAAQIRWRHLEVLFARDENSADDQIAAMLRRASNPQRIVVVSSDHRVQVAARRRKATPIDSDQWFDAVLELTESAPARTEAPEEDEAPEALTPAELEEFRRTMTSMTQPEEDASRHDSDEEIDNPFPQGYFDDLDEGDLK